MDDYQESIDDTSDISDADEPAQRSKTTKRKDKALPTSKDGKSENVVKRAARKISATAHANFCKLKIKNKNSKAKGGGRFGRR